MRRFLGFLVFLCLVPARGGAAPHFQAEPEVTEMRSDAQVFGVADLKGLRATFDVAAPPNAVLHLLWDVARFREVFPDVKSVTVKSREDTHIVVRFTVDAVVQEAEYTLDRRLDRAKREITWRETGEGDVKTIRGRWQLTPHDGGTRVAYESYVDVGRFVPTSMVRSLAIRKVSAMAERVRAAAATSSHTPAQETTPTAAR